MGRWRSVVLALLLTGSAAAAVGAPSAAQDPAAEDRGSPTAPTASPLLEALTLMPAGSETFEFLDWTALKALHGGAAVTSASPIDERQRLLLAIARSEASPVPLGLDRLEPWRERWGWDTTDLAWQAGVAPFVSILRFGDDWDPEPFIARLAAYGYARDDQPQASVFTPGPGTEPPPDAPLERILGLERRILDEPIVLPASVALLPDRRTVAVVVGDGAEKTLLDLAAGADPAAVADSPFGRVATTLGRPVAARILDGQYGCSGTGEELAFLSVDDLALARAVGPLEAYLAFGSAYERAGPGEPVSGRYAFVYERADQAEADLPGRRRLIGEGGSSVRGLPDLPLELVEASTDGPALVLEVTVPSDQPQVLLDLTIRRPLLFAICG